MEFLKALGIVVIGATFVTLAVMIVIASPFFLWALFTSRGGVVKLPGWLDKRMFPIAVVLWLIVAGALLIAVLAGAFT